MADNVVFNLNYDGVSELLKSRKMKKVLENQASQVAQRAGENFEVYTAQTRAVVEVREKNEAGTEENLKGNNLLKAVRG